MVNLRSGREISDLVSPYFIAEMNTSHFGDLSKAKDIQELEETVVTAYKEKLIDPEGASGGTIGREQLAALPIRSAAEATARRLGGGGGAYIL